MDSWKASAHVLSLYRCHIIVTMVNHGDEENKRDNVPTHTNVRPIHVKEPTKD